MSSLSVFLPIMWGSFLRGKCLTFLQIVWVECCLCDITFFLLNILITCILVNLVDRWVAQSMLPYFYWHSGVSNYFFRLSDYCHLWIMTDVPKDFSSACTAPLSLWSTQILNCFSVMFPWSRIPLLYYVWFPNFKLLCLVYFYMHLPSSFWRRAY